MKAGFAKIDVENLNDQKPDPNPNEPFWDDLEHQSMQMTWRMYQYKTWLLLPRQTGINV